MTISSFNHKKKFFFFKNNRVKVRGKLDLMSFIMMTRQPRVSSGGGGGDSLPCLHLFTTSYHLIILMIFQIKMMKRMACGDDGSRYVQHDIMLHIFRACTDTSLLEELK